MTRMVDLDDLTGLERAWGELERVRAIRALDPELRRNIERHLVLLDPDEAAPIRAALDTTHPEVVLAHFFTTILGGGHIGGSIPAKPSRPQAPRRPGTPTSYTKVFHDMVEAGWPHEVAAEAVLGIALEDGLASGEVTQLLPGSP